MTVKPYALLATVIIILASCQAKKSINVLNEVDSQKGNIQFPSDWLGHYAGDLQIFTTKGKVMTVAMELEISELNEEGYFPWKLKYGEDDIRDYGLFPRDSIGHFVIDEFNGILIDGYAMGNNFLSHFSVGSSEITSIYTRSPAGLEFQIISSVSDTLTNSAAEDEGQVFEVGSFPVNVYQKAYLQKN